MRRLQHFLSDRLPLHRPLRRFLSDPQPGSVGWLHTLGSGLLFLLVTQFLTGGVLLVFYAPTPDHAWQSLRFLETTYPSGHLVRSLHVWGASLAVIVATLHILRVVAWGAYRRPREISWVLGMVTFLLLLGLSFTGYLLPWDQKGYWATQVGLEMISSGPGAGPILATLLRGGDGLGAYTLSRFFALHVFFLPGLLLLATLGHLYLVRTHKVAPHPDPARRVDRTFPFYPEQMARDSVLALLILGILLGLSFLVPAGLEAVADPLDTSYEPRPEWYFLAHYELLRMITSPKILATVVLPTLIVLGLLLLPFLAGRESGRPGFVRPAPVAVLALFVLMYGAAGYSILMHSTGGGGLSEEALPLPEDGDPEQMRRGRRAFLAAECVGCHQLQGEGGIQGPDLSQAGWKFSLDHLKLQILNPQANNPDARMPAFEGQISDQDLEDLVQYLSRMH